MSAPDAATLSDWIMIVVLAEQIRQVALTAFYTRQLADDLLA